MDNYQALLKEFSRNLEGKDIDELLQRAKTESESRILGQGIAYIALFISEAMVQAITTAERGEHSIPLAAS